MVDNFTWLAWTNDIINLWYFILSTDYVQLGRLKLFYDTGRRTSFHYVLKP